MNWKTLCTNKWVQQNGVDEYWGKRKINKGRIRGQIQILARMLQDLTSESKGPSSWKQGDEYLDLDNMDDLKGFIGKKAVNRTWGKLQKSRFKFQGLDEGRDDVLSHPGKKHKWNAKTG